LEPTADATQFSKALLVNHGELEDGQIPEALKYQRPLQVTTLSNGLRVASEFVNGQLATVGVHIKAGTRHEAFEKSGMSALAKTMAFQGTDNMSAQEL
jgi:predicted Zn-dependent peptidase